MCETLSNKRKCRNTNATQAKMISCIAAFQNPKTSYHRSDQQVIYQTSKTSSFTKMQRAAGQQQKNATHVREDYNH